jgi:hypothetical protein
MNEKLAKVKSYISSNAPQLVTAVASVGILATVIRTQMVQEDRRNAQANALDQAHAAGWDFDFYPGVGMIVHGKLDDKN